MVKCSGFHQATPPRTACIPSLQQLRPFQVNAYSYGASSTCSIPGLPSLTPPVDVTVFPPQPSAPAGSVHPRSSAGGDVSISVGSKNILMEVSFPWLAGKAEIIHFSSSKILILLPFRGIVLAATLKWSQSRSETAPFMLKAEGWLKSRKMSLFFNFFLMWKARSRPSPALERTPRWLFAKGEQRKALATLAIE